VTIEEAKKVGSNQALKSVGIGLLIAQLIMTLLSSDGGFLKELLWFTHFGHNLNLAIGAIIMLISGYYFGQRAGYEILIKKKDYTWVGFKYGIIILMTTAFFASWTGFFQEGIRLMGTNDNPFIDYIYKPLFWVFIFVLFPVLIVGFWFGKQIKERDF